MGTEPDGVSLEPTDRPVGRSPKRRQLLAWFRANAAPLDEAYEAALSLLERPGLPCRVHLVSHLVRDIADRLVYVLDPQLDGERVQYANKLDLIMDEWPPLDSVEHQDATDPPEVVSITYPLAVQIDRLVHDHREMRGRPSHYELLFRYLMRREPVDADVSARLVADFKRVRNWFMAHTHVRRAHSEIDEEVLQRQFARFEDMLHSFVGDFFTGTEELDAILGEANQ